MSAVLEVRNLSKRYPNGVVAVDGVSFVVQAGRCFGLLGPNGAGKTTTIEIMEGILPATGGEVLYRGEVLGARFREEVGIQFQTTALQDFLKVRDQLQLFASFYPRGLPLAEVIETCALEQLLERDSRMLSGGQRQRLLLALALVNDPQILFLDEPTTGLDPQARRNFWELIERIKARGKTILLTTHYMEEAYLLCDEIAIMDHGKVIARGAPRVLLAEHYNESVLELPAEDVPEQLPLPVLRHNGRVELVTRDVNAALQELLAAGARLQHLQVRPRTLEDLFLHLTGKALRA